MKVKMCFNTDCSDLEREINKFVDTPFVNVINIKFSMSKTPDVVVSGDLIIGHIFYSVLIMYESTVAD